MLCAALLGLGTMAMAVESEDAPPAADGGVVDKTHVYLTVRSRGSKAVVYYGRKKLGTTPVKLKWKRDSGPLDLVLRAGGHLPVATRIYTDRDDTVIVDMTAKSKAHTLYGYKRIPDAAPIEAPAADGGIVPMPGPAGPASAPAVTPP